MTTSLTFDLKQAIQNEKEHLIHLRRYLHQHPEASLKEYETSKFIQEKLTELAIPYEKVGETGTLATLVGGAGYGKTIVLRGDIDALELPDETGKPYASRNTGLNHACGHDGHTAILLTVAKILKAHQAAFKGTIKFAFQQAEEIGAGAKQFVTGGFLDDADQVFGIHLDASVPVGKLVATPGPTNASCDIFTIEVTGLSSHVGQPDQGHDALLAGADIVVALQNIVAREISPLDPVVVGIGRLDAGTRYNIVANHAHIQGTVRTFNHQTRAFVLQRVKEIAETVAKTHRTKISWDVYDAAAPLINEENASNLAAKVASEIVGAGNVITDLPKSMGADDFADFLTKAPGIYGRVGTRNLNNPETHYAHHHEKFDIDEDGLSYAVAYHILYALTYLEEN